jgi:uncharacterized caspase-like protein
MKGSDRKALQRDNISQLVSQKLANILLKFHHSNSIVIFDACLRALKTASV